MNKIETQYQYIRKCIPRMDKSCFLILATVDEMIWLTHRSIGIRLKSLQEAPKRSKA